MTNPPLVVISALRDSTGFAASSPLTRLAKDCLIGCNGAAGLEIGEIAD